MMGGISPYATKVPLKRPIIKPTAMATIKTSKAGRPAAKARPDTAQAIPIVEPTETSIPAVIITIVMPMEAVTIPAVCKSKLEMLLILKKRSVKMEKTTTKAPISINTLNSLLLTMVSQ
jgi:hypothetical protein